MAQDCNDRRKKSIIREILVGLSVGAILAITGYTASNIPDLKSKTSLLAYQFQQTDCKIGKVSEKLDQVSEKVESLSLDIVKLDEKSNYLQKTLELHMKRELGLTGEPPSYAKK
jgi:cell division protein FtsB